MSNPFVLGLIFVLSLATLIKASDLFTDSAEKAGLILGLPPFVIGVTIVSIGTSLPELVTSILAVTSNASEVVLSNVVGSNIANMFLVVGMAAIISAKSISIVYDLVSVDLPLFVGSAFLLALQVADQNLSKAEAALLVLGYLVYVFYIIKGSQENVAESEGESLEDIGLDQVEIKQGRSFLTRQILWIALSAILIFLGAKYTIESLVGISNILNIGKETIAVSAVALGTSLPELIVTIGAALKGKAEVAVGNVLGSNVFNTFMVMGIPGLIGELAIPESVLRQGLPTMVAGTILLFFSTQDQKLTIWEGWLFFILYVWFIGQTFNLF